MTQKQWKTIVVINLIVILLVLSPFLPGPSFLSGVTNTIFSLAQMSGFLGVILVPIGIIWTLSQIKKEKKSIFAILLCTVPVVGFTMSIWGVDPVRNFSRAFAINNANELIQAIEKFNDANKRYPNNISELEPRYINSQPKPWIMGISGYDYKRTDEKFNLSFCQNVLFGFNFEVVVYDSTGKHTAEGEMKTLYSTENDNWKYYIYD